MRRKLLEILVGLTMQVPPPRGGHFIAFDVSRAPYLYLSLRLLNCRRAIWIWPGELEMDSVKYIRQARWTDGDHNWPMSTMPLTPIHARLIELFKNMYREFPPKVGWHSLYAQKEFRGGPWELTLSLRIPEGYHDGAREGHQDFSIRDGELEGDMQRFVSETKMHLKTLREAADAERLATVQEDW